MNETPASPKSGVPPSTASPASDRADLRPENIRDAVIRLAGNSQDGIQSAGAFLARLAGRSDQDVMTYMTIPATISGGPSIFQVRMGTGEVLSAGDEADFLVAFYQHSYQDHIGFLKEGGVLLYDSDNVEPNLDDKRFVYVGVPITGLTVEALGGTAKDKGKNIFVLGLISKIFSLDVEKLKRLITERFSGKDESIVNTALMAFHAGYAYPVGKILSHHYQFEKVEKKAGARDQITMDGNQALAYGLLAAGVRYGAGYPITPWSSVMEILRSEFPKYGGLFVQAEDELGAVSIALGFSYSGYLAITGSAGPGISLKTEAIGWASMAEMPLIIINVQRGGPSTGLPTNVEQSDLHQAIYGGHGDSPRVVLAAQTVEDCFYIAIEAARIARKYSTPVFILSDTSLATRIEAFDEPKLAELMIEPKPDLTPRAAGYKPYDLNKITQHVPPGTRMLDGKYPLMSGLEHDEMGHPTGSPKMHMAMTAKRRNKLRQLAEEIPLPEVFGEPEGDVLLVGWGSTYGPIHDAVKLAQGSEKLSAIHLRHIHPLPNGLEKIFARFKRIVVVEMNDQGVYGFGQLATILRARYCEPKIESFTKTDGLTFRVKEIVEGVFKRPFGKPASPNGSSTEAKVSPRAELAGDTTPTKPGTEAADASSGVKDHSKHPSAERADNAEVALSASKETKK